MNVITIEIIDPSPPLSVGLKTLIETCSKNYRVIGVYQDLSSFNVKRKEDPHVILINPLLIDFHTDVRNVLTSCCTKAILVAIPYGHINSKALEGYDGELNVFEDGPELCRVLTKIVDKYRTDDTKNAQSLSNLDKAIIREVAQGIKNKEIAAKLKLSVHTVISYRRRIADKIGVKGIVGLVNYARLYGLIKE